MSYIRSIIIYGIVFLAPIHTLWAQWSVDEEEEGCIRYKGPEKENTIPIKVVCTWSLKPVDIQKILSLPEDFETCFSRVKASYLLKNLTKSSSLKRVYQIHDGSPASDRAIYLDYIQSTSKNKWMMAFKKSPSQEVKSIDKKWVAVKVHQGKWTVEPHSKGVRVTLQSIYDPGGSVPSFLVRWFMGTGVQKMMDELHTCARKAS